MIKKTMSLTAALFFMLLPCIVSAQTAEAGRKYTAFDMRSNGKIYVLTACILIIMIGMIAYMVRLDRKMGKLEKEIK